MTLAEEIADLKQRQQSLRNLITVTRTDATNDEFVARTIAEHEERIAWHQKMIADIRLRRENAPEIIERAQRGVAACGKRLAIMQNQRLIEKMVAMQEEINRLTGEGEEEYEDEDEDIIDEGPSFRNAACEGEEDE